MKWPRTRPTTSFRIRFNASSGLSLTRRMPAQQSKHSCSTGFRRSDIDILSGEQGLHRLDPSGAEHGFFAQFQRTVLRAFGPAEEFKSLSRHAEDVRAGRFVIMVLAEAA